MAFITGTSTTPLEKNTGKYKKLRLADSYLSAYQPQKHSGDHQGCLKDRGTGLKRLYYNDAEHKDHCTGQKQSSNARL
jgi:hypothetical protein